MNTGIEIDLDSVTKRMRIFPTVCVRLGALWMCCWCRLAPCVAHLNKEVVSFCLYPRQVLPFQSFVFLLALVFVFCIFIVFAFVQDSCYLSRALRSRHSSVCFVSLPRDRRWLGARVVPLPPGHHKHHFLVVLRGQSYLVHLIWWILFGGSLGNLIWWILCKYGAI